LLTTLPIVLSNEVNCCSSTILPPSWSQRALNASEVSLKYASRLSLTMIALRQPLE